MKWFRHDSNANTDAKLRRVRMKYGLEGYGLYWYCLELIAAGVEAHNLTFELEHDSEIIAFDTGLHRDIVQEMMTYFCNLGLFENVDGTITCLKMASRTDEYIRKTLRTNSGQTPDKLRIKSRLIEEKRIEEKRKEKKEPKKTVNRFSPPTLEEVKAYCAERGNSVDADGFIDYYQSNGWKVGRNSMKNWKAAVRRWEKKDKVKNDSNGPRSKPLVL